MYSSVLELKSYMDITDTDNDAELERALLAASSWIDRRCGRTFTLDTANQTKVYAPSFEGLVDVIDLQTISTIKVDTNGDRSYATTLLTTDYELLPRSGPPYQQITIWPTSSKSFSDRLVQIVGKFGYTVDGHAPYDVQQAALILASRYFKRREAPFGVLSSTDLGQFERLSKEDPDVVSLLAPYVRTGSSWVLV